MMREHTNLKFLDCLENNLIIPLSLAGEGGVRGKSRNKENELWRLD
jgi:hypothetical protein